MSPAELLDMFNPDELARLKSVAVGANGEVQAEFYAVSSTADVLEPARVDPEEGTYIEPARPFVERFSSITRMEGLAFVDMVTVVELTRTTGHPFSYYIASLWLDNDTEELRDFLDSGLYAPALETWQSVLTHNEQHLLKVALQNIILVQPRGSIQTTVDVYGHLAPGSNRNAVNKLDDNEVKKGAELFYLS